jgi:hypothetical protein
MTAPLPLTRGRRIALAIGVPACLLLVSDTGLNLVANMGQGTFPVSYTAPAGARSLTVGLSGGQLLFTAAASGPARLTGTARYSLIRAHLTTRATASGAVVGYQCVFPFGDCELNATVSVPAAMPVAASTDGGNATVTGTTGPVTLSTGGGDLSADQVSGRLSLNTSGGNIAATAIGSADVTAASGGGDIEIVFTRVPRPARRQRQHLRRRHHAGPSARPDAVSPHCHHRRRHDQRRRDPAEHVLPECNHNEIRRRQHNHSPAVTPD